MAVDLNTILGKGQILWDSAATPKRLLVGDGTHKIKELPNVLDRSDIMAAIEALTGSTIKVSDAEDAKTIEDVVTELFDLATGAQMGIVFEDEAQLREWLAGTYTRPDGLTKADLVIGQNIFLRAEDEPDYWWDGTNALELNTKTDLSDYSTTAQMTTAIGTAVTAAIDALPAYSKTGPANDGSGYLIRDGAWEKAVLDSSDITPEP